MDKHGIKVTVESEGKKSEVTYSGDITWKELTNEFIMYQLTGVGYIIDQTKVDELFS